MVTPRKSMKKAMNHRKCPAAKDAPNFDTCCTFPKISAAINTVWYGDKTFVYERTEVHLDFNL